MAISVSRGFFLKAAGENMSGVRSAACAAAAVDSENGRKSEAFLGVVAALDREVGPLLRIQHRAERLNASCYRVPFGATRGIVTVAGIGADSAYRAALELINGFSVRALLSFGFAGALDEALRPGELVLAEEVIEQSSGRRFRCEPNLVPLQQGKRGKLLSVAEVIRTAAQKSVLSARWNALAVDMESAGVGQAASEAGIPFAAVRSITDTASQSLAIDFQRCRSEHGKLSYSRVFLEVARNPRGIRDLILLATGSRLAAESLALALSCIS